MLARKKLKGAGAADTPPSRSMSSGAVDFGVDRRIQAMRRLISVATFRAAGGARFRHTRRSMASRIAPFARGGDPRGVVHSQRSRLNY